DGKVRAAAKSSPAHSGDREIWDGIARLVSILRPYSSRGGTWGVPREGFHFPQHSAPAVARQMVDEQNPAQVLCLMEEAASEVPRPGDLDPCAGSIDPPHGCDPGPRQLVEGSRHR